VKRIQSAALFLSIILVLSTLVSLTAYGVGVSPTVLNVVQVAGAEETYVITILNNTDGVENLKISLGDWLRLPEGEYDWTIPLRSARWTFAEGLAAGETVSIRYTAQLPSNAPLTVTGSFETGHPLITGQVLGPDEIAVSAVGAPPAALSDEIWAARTVEKIDVTGLATIHLEVHTDVAVERMTLYETFSQRVDLASLNAGGGTFATVNHSSAEWVTLSFPQITLQPGETRELLVRVDVPPDAVGTSWSAVFVAAEPKPEPGPSGTQIVNIYRIAVQMYVTAAGTQQVTGQLIGVDVLETDPLTVAVDFENTGNALAIVSGSVNIVDQSGTTVRTLAVPERYVLPGDHRIITVVDEESAEPLPPGIYQAVALIDYGVDTLTGGVRGFRVK
jgi:hypothetical protein